MTIAKITSRNHVNQLAGLLLFIAISAVAYYFVVKRINDEYINVMLLVFILFTLMGCLPTLVLHIRYTIVNRATELRIDEENMRVIILHDDVEHQFEVQDIESVVTSMTPAHAFYQLDMLPFQSYCYSRLKLTNGEAYLLTCLLVPDMNWPISMPNESVHKEIFCWPKGRTVTMPNVGDQGQ